MLVTIHQPNFLPWPGFFHKWLLADALILLDTVQYEKNEWQNRNRIKTAQGAQWLTVPVRYRYPQKINEVTIADQRWPRKLCGSIEQAYARAPYLKVYWPQLRDILNEPCESLRDMNIALIRAVGGFLGCHAPISVASGLTVENTDPTGRLLELCAAIDADGYLSGQEGRAYLDAGAFARNGMKLYFQHVDAPVYTQLHGNFVSHLSILDLLLNLGPEAADVVKNMGGIGE
ncbi:MAG: WbqC family protein [Mariprofundaceae bacterium]